MTIHRALGFVDRSVLTDDSPLRVVMASEGRQADKIDLRMSGADLARFRGNPVLGYGHSYWGRTNLPIGRVKPDTLLIADRQLSGDLEFDQEDPFAREVERKMRAGYINAVSIGFDVTQWESAEDSYWRGGVATKWELSELSVVPVPMDASALVSSGREMSDDEAAELRRRLEEALRSGRGPTWLTAEAAFDPGLAAFVRDCSEAKFAQLAVRMQALYNIAAGRGPTVDSIASTPDGGPEITPDAARSLLAAFAPKEN